MKKSTDSDSKQINKKVKIGIFIGVILVAIAITSIVAIVLCNQPEMSDDETLEQEVTIVEESTIDFNQKITAEDGKDAKTTYELGDKNNLSVRFPDLKCNEQCSNVKNLKLNNQNLVLGKDYEVKSGSVIIIILSEYMETLKTGQYELTFEITSDEKESIIGLNITIKDDVPTCTENQTLENNKCIEKKVEQPAANNTQKPTNTDPSNSNTTWNGVPLVDYSTGVAAYNIPEPNFHKRLSRAEYNANKGWESAVFYKYGDYLRKLRGESSPEYMSGTSSFTCYAQFSYDFDTMTISSPSWDDSPTSTCDSVRNELAPVPSAEYLTALLRKIHASDCYLNNVNWTYCRNPQW